MFQVSPTSDCLTLEMTSVKCVINSDPHLGFLVHLSSVEGFNPAFFGCEKSIAILKNASHGYCWFCYPRSRYWLSSTGFQHQVHRVPSMVTSSGLWPIYYEHNFWRFVCGRGGPLGSLSRYAIVPNHTAYSTCRIAVQSFR